MVTNRQHAIAQDEGGTGVQEEHIIMTTIQEGRWLIGSLVLLAATAANAQDFDLLGISMDSTHQFTLGANMRMQDRDHSIIGKTNIPGQQGLCEADDCVSSSGDPAPNQRFVDAPGFYSVNGDDGNLNYDKYDLTAAVVRLRSEFNLSFTDWLYGFVRTSAFYDPINVDFDEYHPHNVEDGQANGYEGFQPRRTPRSAAAQEDIGTNLELLDAYLTAYLPLPMGDRELTRRVGRQVLNWGESTFLVPNSLNHISPPNLARLNMPGSDTAEIFDPIALVVASTNLTDNLSMELNYHLDWQAVVADPAGSFFSTSDIAGGGDYAMLSFGKAPEDPEQISTPAGLTALLSDSSRTTLRVEDRRASDDGQYGIALRYFADWLGPGTELAFYHANYHSRFPIASFTAADASSCRAADGITAPGLPLPGIGTVGPEQLACLGLLGADPAAIASTIGGALAGQAAFPGNALPVDTGALFLEYPEDIKLWGFSFNTLIGDVALQGEYAFRENLPVQVHQVDLVYAHLQPAFPENDVDLLGLATVPGARNAVPDYVETRYRGNTNIQPGDYIRGYERLKVGQLNLGGTVTFGGSNWFGADQILGVYELGMVHVVDMPDENEIQFQGSGTDTHFSAGADGTGSGGVPDARRQNPTQQRNGFASEFSWGYRLVSLFTYNNAILGANVSPLFGLFHDVQGYSPGPGGLFVEGSKRLFSGIRFDYLNRYTGEMRYTWYTGGGEDNQLRDRDSLMLTLGYAF